MKLMDLLRRRRDREREIAEQQDKSDATLRAMRDVTDDPDQRLVVAIERTARELRRRG